MHRVAILAIAALAAVLAVPGAASAKRAKSPQEISAYWTDARMKAAKPRDRARPGGGGGGKTTDWSGFAVPYPYAGQSLANGKLFLTIDGANYVCSGTGVQSSTSGVNLVWTAGHCVTDGVDSRGVEHKATNVMFVPAYYNGQEPYGRYAASGAAIDSTPGWENSGGTDFRYDVGAARVTQAVAGKPSLLPLTRPIAFQSSLVGTKVVSYGYPAAGKFNGQVMRACASAVRREDVYESQSPRPVQIGCDMTGGSSGGGWILDSNGDRLTQAGEPLVSVNSYGYGFEKTTMYGPQMPPVGQAQALYAAMD